MLKCTICKSNEFYSYCHRGEEWQFTTPTYYFYTSSHKTENIYQIGMNKPALYRVPQIEVTGKIKLKPYYVNILIEKFNERYNKIHLIWMNLYMGPLMKGWQFSNPLGNCESPF